MNKTVMITGSFDPPTNGHINLIERTSSLFSDVVVVIADNLKKNYLFSIEERLSLLKECVKAYPNVRVDVTHTLVAEYAKLHGINTIVRGVRNASDYSYEAELALTNHMLNENLDTLFLPAFEKYRGLRSSGVRELAHYGVDVSLFVPDVVKKALLSKKA